MERRLSAILAADMVGYSRLMEADEIGTIARQRAHRKQLIDPTFDRFNGRIVKTTGDGLLAEFSSVVDAVQCAVTIQQAMNAREADQPEDRRIRYRIGINLGDVVAEDGDLYGDGVNIAARLEALAEPGGIQISGTAYDHLKSNVDVGYEALGEIAVKNISQPVRVYRVLTDPDSIGETVPARAPRRWLWPAAALAVLVVALGSWWWMRTDFDKADPNRMAFALPDKPSIAVLPFADLTGDQTDRYLADGFVESLIMELSRSPDLFVISRPASFAYRDGETPLNEISEALGVRYVVEGNFRKLGDQLRVTVQLSDAVAGNQIWAGRYDRSAREFYVMQDDLIGDLVREIGGRGASGVFGAERRRMEAISNEDLSMIELWEKASQAFFKFTREGNEVNGEIATEMVARRPDHPRGHVALGYYHLSKIWLGYSDDPKSDVMQCFAYANKAIALDAQDYHGHMLLSYCMAMAGRSDEAASSMARAYDLNPNDIVVQREYAKQYLVRTGRYEAAIEMFEGLLRLSPGQQVLSNSDFGWVWFQLGDYAKAVHYIQKESVRSISNVRLAAAYWMNGQHDEARVAVAALLEQRPAYSIENFQAGVTWMPKEAVQVASDALIAAGVPESAPAQND